MLHFRIVDRLKSGAKVSSSPPAPPNQGGQRARRLPQPMRTEEIVRFLREEVRLRDSDTEKIMLRRLEVRANFDDEQELHLAVAHIREALQTDPAARQAQGPLVSGRVLNLFSFEQNGLTHGR